MLGEASLSSMVLICLLFFFSLLPGDAVFD